MKIFKILLIVGLSGLTVCTSSEALKGVLATNEDIIQLKKDLRNKYIQIGKTRLKKIRDTYGEAVDITDSNKKIVYNYKDLKITFIKKRYWKEWEYDGFHDRAYTDDIDDLRSDLESEELVGDNITFTRIRNDYGEPTESEETDEDGNTSVYYYGNIKMVFENYIVLQSWKGKNMSPSKDNGGLGSIKK